MEQLIAYQCKVFKNYARNLGEYVFNNIEEYINKRGSLLFITIIIILFSVLIHHRHPSEHGLSLIYI